MGIRQVVPLWYDQVYLSMVVYYLVQWIDLWLLILLELAYVLGKDYFCMQLLGVPGRSSLVFYLFGLASFQFFLIFVSAFGHQVVSS